MRGGQKPRGIRGSQAKIDERELTRAQTLAYIEKLGEFKKTAKLNFSKTSHLKHFAKMVIDALEPNKKYAEAVKKNIDRYGNAVSLRKFAKMLRESKEEGNVRLGERPTSILNKVIYNGRPIRERRSERQKEVEGYLSKINPKYVKILRAYTRGMGEKDKLDIINAVAQSEHGFIGGTPDDDYDEDETNNWLKKMRELADEKYLDDRLRGGDGIKWRKVLELIEEMEEV